MKRILFSFLVLAACDGTSDDSLTVKEKSLEETKKEQLQLLEKSKEEFLKINRSNPSYFYRRITFTGKKYKNTNIPKIDFTSVFVSNNEPICRKYFSSELKRNVYTETKENLNTHVKGHKAVLVEEYLDRCKEYINTSSEKVVLRIYDNHVLQTCCVHPNCENPSDILGIYEFKFTDDKPSDCKL